MLQERRIAARAHVRITANCIKSSDSTYSHEYFPSVTKDLSPHGAYLITFKPLKASERIMLGLDVPDYFIPILAYGEVMWIHTEECDGNKCFVTEAGIRFFKIGNLDSDKLNDFIFSQKVREASPYFSSANSLLRDKNI